MSTSKVSEKSFAFSIAAIVFYIQAKKRREFVLASQFLRSSTSIGANIREASAAVSRKDFVNKMSIASKESRETLYWIEIFQKSKDLDLNTPELSKLHDECTQLCRMLTSIVKTINAGLLK